jgi:hypothetical protein
MARTMANKWICFLMLGLSSCGAAEQKPAGVATSFAAPHASFQNYRTFSFGLADQPKPGYEVTQRSLEVAQRLQPIVLEALRARGYENQEGPGDFVVKLVTGTGRGQTRPSRGYQASGGPAAETRNANAAVGFVGINVYDAPTGVQVWQGTAFAEVDLRRIDDDLLEMAVAHMLSSFPPKNTRLAGAP